MEWRSKDEARAWAKSFVKEFHRPCVVMLSGTLGAGKTQFVRWFLEELGVKNATSPTFAIHQEHESPSGSIDHVDLYRLENDADLESTGFWDLLRNPQALLLVEWADRLPDDVWPKTWTRLKIHLDKDARGEEFRQGTIVIEPVGSKRP